MIFDLGRDFTYTLATFPRKHPKRRTLELFEEAIRRDIHFIDRHPTALFQCMWNLCWWYDCPEAAKHYVEPEGGWSETPPWVDNEPTRLAHLLERWRKEKEVRHGRFPWLRSLRPHKPQLGSALKGVLRGHKVGSWITSLAYSVDGKYLASGSADKTIRIWDTGSCAELRVLQGHNREFVSVSFSPDGARVVSCSDDFTVCVWDLSGGKPLFTYRDRIPTSNVAFSPDGNRIVFGTDDGTVHILDGHSGFELHVLQGHSKEVSRIAVSPCGGKIVSIGSDFEIRLWDTHRGERSRQLCEKAFFQEHPIAMEIMADERRILVASDRGNVWICEVGLDGEVIDVSAPGNRLLAFSRGGDRCVSTADDWRTLLVWDTDTGAEVAVLPGHRDAVETATFSFDRKVFASGSWDGVVLLWGLQGSHVTDEINDHDDEIYSIAFSPEGTYLASGSSDMSVRLWEVETGAQTRVLNGHEALVGGVVFSPNGRHVVSRSYHKTLVSDVANGDTLTVLPEGGSEILAFSPDGLRIITAKSDEAQIWDPERQFSLRTLRGLGPFAYSPDSRRAFTGTTDPTVHVYDYRTDTTLLSLRGYEKSVSSICYSPDGNQIVSGGDNIVRIWDTRSGVQTGLLRGHESYVTSVTYSPDGRWVASASHDNTIRLWDVDLQSEVRVLHGTDKYTHVAFSPDGQCLVAGSFDGSIQVWEVSGGHKIYALQAGKHLVNQVAFSPDGTRIVSSDYNSVRLWDVQRRIEIASIRSIKSNSPAVFSPDGRSVALRSADDTIILREANTGTVLKTLEGDYYGADCLAFSRDGQHMASNSYDGSIRIWDVNTGMSVNTIAAAPHSTPSGVTFSPEGGTIAYSSGAYNIHVWDGHSFDELAVLSGHAEFVTSIALSPESRRLVSGSSDGTALIWDSESGQVLVVLRGHDSEVTSVAFSADGSRVLSGTRDGSVRVWDVTTGLQLMVLKDHEHCVTSLAFMNTAQRIISASRDRTREGRWFDIHVCSAKSGECLRSITDANDTTAVSDAAAGYRWLAYTQGYETTVLCADSLLECAWFPVSPQHPAVSSACWTWAGASAEHLILFRLEGPKEPDEGE